MGLQCFENDKNKNIFSIRNEEKVKAGENLNTKNTKILLKKAEKSVCEIVKDTGYGSGFFCKIKYPNNYNEEIYCLITNNHVITKDMLINKKILK